MGAFLALLYQIIYSHQIYLFWNNIVKTVSWNQNIILPIISIKITFVLLFDNNNKSSTIILHLLKQKVPMHNVIGVYNLYS